MALHPVRAIPRKNVPAAVALCEDLGATYWLAGDAEESREQLFAELGERVRDIHEGIDGWIYLVTDSGRFIRIRN